MTPETKNQILTILNPVRNLTVSECMRVSNILTGNEHSAHFQAIQLMQRWEELTKQPLEKKHFVCEVEKPKKEGYTFIGNEQQELWFAGAKEDYEKKLEAYESALKEVIFDVFEGEEYEMPKVTLFKASAVEVLFGDKFVRLFIDGWCVSESPTIAELIFEIDRYNRTASTKIELKFTESFCNKLLS